MIGTTKIRRLGAAVLGAWMVLAAPAAAELAGQQKGPPPMPARELIQKLRSNELGRDAITRQYLPEVRKMTMGELLEISSLVDRKEQNLHTGSVLYKGLDTVAERISVDTARALIGRFAQVYDYRWAFAERLLPKVERLDLEDLPRIAVLLGDGERFFEKAVRYLDGELPFSAAYQVISDAERLGYGDPAAVAVRLLPKVADFDHAAMQRLLALVEGTKARAAVTLRALDFLMGGMSADQAINLVRQFPEKDAWRMRVAHKALAEVRGLDEGVVKALAGLFQAEDQVAAIEGRGERLLLRALSARR